MNMVRHKRHWAIRWMIAAFIAVMFADAANLPDIFLTPSFIVVHEDGDADVSSLFAQHDPGAASAPHAGTLIVTTGQKSAVRTMYDEDSPSLQAVTPAALISIHTLSLDARIGLLDPLVIEEIYLRNSSFLI
ncbi:MAG TPA: hypothetical protein VK470_18310 [Bacteroidota bacterium]|nr:hypothetical protein [Bacteroidota bacterium]